MGFALLGAVWLIHQVDWFQCLFQDSLGSPDTKSTRRVEVFLKHADLFLSALRLYDDDIKPMSWQLLLKGRNVPSDRNGGVLEHLSH